MAEALNEYGYSPEDRIERREICKIYGAVKSDMENEIKRLTKNNAYVKAKALRATLVGIRKEFDALQTTKVASSHLTQQSTFTKAEELFHKHLDDSLAKHLIKTEQACKDLEQEMATNHAIEIDNLEFKISKMEVPRVKFSKRVIELTRYADV
jgi:hypothetical protein